MCRVDLRRHLSKRLGVDLAAQLHPQRLVLLLLQIAHLVGDLPDARHPVVVRLRDLDGFRVPPLVDDVALHIRLQRLGDDADARRADEVLVLAAAVATHCAYSVAAVSQLS